MTTPALTPRLIAAALSLALATTARSQDAEPGAEKPDIAKAEASAKAHLEKLDAGRGAIARIDDAATARALPGFAAFAVVFRQFPIARPLPKGLSVGNVLVVDAKGKTEALTTREELEKWFKANLPVAKTDDAAKDAARAWVRLNQELHQDGFYTFRLEDDSTKVAAAKGGRTASAKTVVTAGGNGTVAVTLTLSDAGRVTAVAEKATLTPGPRPRCQATKLLDPDPIVRGMAEDAILGMGRAAKPYLDEQRAKAGADLRRAIDAMWRRIEARDGR